MEYKITRDTLYTCDKYGNIIREICKSVNSASYSESTKLFLVTFLNGKVETRDTHGNRVRVISEGAIDAKFDGQNILVRTKSGNKIVDKFGNIIRRV